MQSKRVLALLGGAAIGVIGASFPMITHAQPVQAQPPTGTEAMVNHSIPVHNVRATWMAWWLDPAHNYPPVQVLSARENAKLFPETGDLTGLPLGVKVPALPAGVQRIVAIDPQNALLVFGTKAGVEELQKTIELLDKPIRQVEVEARYVEITEAEVAALPIEFGAVQPDQPNVGGAGAGIDAAVAALVALVAQGRAKVLTAPRVTAISGLMASLQSTTSTPAVIASKDENGNLLELFDPAGEQAPLFYSTSIGLSVLPTLNADQTVTLRIALEQPVRLTTEGQKPLLDLGKPTLLRTLTNLRDGEVRVVKGLDSRVFRQQGQNAPPKECIVLVSARIIRRADDDVKTVALQR